MTSIDRPTSRSPSISNSLSTSDLVFTLFLFLGQSTQVNREKGGLRQSIPVLVIESLSRVCVDARQETSVVGFVCSWNIYLVTKLLIQRALFVQVIQVALSFKLELSLGRNRPEKRWQVEFVSATVTTSEITGGKEECSRHKRVSVIGTSQVLSYLYTTDLSRDTVLPPSVSVTEV